MGCTTTKQVFHPQPVNVPQAFYQCLEPTERPSGNQIMESDTAKYIASLEKVVPDCKYRLIEIKVIIDCFNDSKCDVDSLLRGLEVASSKPKG